MRMSILLGNLDQMSTPSLGPLLTLSAPFDNVHQSQQDGSFDEWSNSRCNCFITLSTIRCDSYHECQFKIVACRCKALCARKHVPKSESLRDHECCEKDDGEVDNQGPHDSNDKDYLVDHLVTL